MTLPLLLPLLVLIPVFHYLLKPPSVSSIPTATPHLPLIGNAISFGVDPIKFLIAQRVRHGDIFLVNLVVVRIAFFLGTDGTNAIFKGTEKSGISFWAAVADIFGPTTAKGVPCFLDGGNG
jgi:sterol 14alpha-demethylase